MPLQVGSNFLLCLPDDVLSLICASLRPRDLCSLSLSCRSLRILASSDKLWLVQCQVLSLLPPRDLSKWRSSLSSYKSLCRFLSTIRPLLGIWVHQNPELGNVVFTMLGFNSIIGCRIIPQELGEKGIDDSPLLWAPVFEIIADFDGSISFFFLHGREKDTDFFYPGKLNSIEPSCNVLLLEVEPNKHPEDSGNIGFLHTKNRNFGAEEPQLLEDSGKNGFLHSKSRNSLGERSGREIRRSESSLSRSRRMIEVEKPIPFNRLAFGDRRKLLEIIAIQVRIRVPESLNCCTLFARSEEDFGVLSERRELLIQMCKLREGNVDCEGNSGLCSDGTQMESSKMKKILDHPGTWSSSGLNENEGHSQNSKRRSVAGYFKDGLKQILGRSNSMNGRNTMLRNGHSNGENKHVPLQEFLRAGDSIELSLRAATIKLTTYRAWPNMHDNRFALYKLPLRAPTTGQEYAGLWGGTMGWPPGRPTEDKPGKALFFLLLSYEESEGQKHLIATKILEGTHYVLHPNGSAMFIVNVDEPSLDKFPWDTDGDSLPVEIQHAYSGEGIANGYGFRYPGSKPGTLFVTQNGLLAFIWKETRAVLTLQRLELQELLKKGERVPPLPPIANFAYLTKSYSNVFAGFASATNCSSLSSRQNYY